MVLRHRDLCWQGHEANAELRKEQVQEDLDRQAAEPPNYRHSAIFTVPLSILHDRLRYLGEPRRSLLPGKIIFVSSSSSSSSGWG